MQNKKKATKNFPLPMEDHTTGKKETIWHKQHIHCLSKIIQFIVVTINLSSFYLDSTVGLSQSYTQHFKSLSKGMDSGKHGIQVPELCWTHWKKSHCYRNKLFHKSNSCCMLDISRKSTIKSFLNKCDPPPYYPLYLISEVFLE